MPVPGPPLENCPFKTLTRALAKIATGLYDPPFVIRVAGRLDNISGMPILHDAVLGESFPLTISPQTLIWYDPVNSDAGAVAAIVGPGPGSGIPVIVFNAQNGVKYPNNGGIDGSGSSPSPYGIEIRDGEAGAVLHAQGVHPTLGASTMEAKLRFVRFTQSFASGQASNDLNIQALNGGQVNVEISDCSFTTENPVTQCPIFSNPAFPGVVQNPALVYVTTNDTGAPQGTSAVVRFSRNTITAGGSPTAVEVTSGIRFEPMTQTAATLIIDDLFLDGQSNADPTNPAGISTGIRVSPCNASPTFHLENSRFFDCGQYGCLLSPPLLGNTSLVKVNIVGNVIQTNGLRASQLPGCLGAACSAACVPTCMGSQEAYCLPGAGIGIELLGSPAASLQGVEGTIDLNQLFGNKVGILVHAVSPPFSTSPGLLSIYGNSISGQVLDPTLLYAAGAGTYTGTGIVLSVQDAGVLGTNVILDSNVISGNPGRGVLLGTRLAAFGGTGAMLQPVLRNDRMYQNGLPPNPAADGVQVLDLGGLGSAVHPRFIFETVWGNGRYGFNAPATTAAELWCSISWMNTTSDLNGFSFANPGATPVVWFTDFCGAPWTLACNPSPPLPTPGPAENFSRRSDPLFVNPAAGDFRLTCGGGSPCASPAHDRAIGSSGAGPPGAPIGLILPFLPTVDAIGQPREIDLAPAAGPNDPVADMGALEKQNFVP
jgi:hypothetical protein